MDWLRCLSVCLSRAYVSVAGTKNAENPKLAEKFALSVVIETPC